MYEPTISTISGQRVDFSDNSVLDVPFELTPKKNDTEITLSLDCTRKTVTFPLDVSKNRFILQINIFLIDHWRINGKKESKPRQVRV